MLKSKPAHLTYRSIHDEIYPRLTVCVTGAGAGVDSAWEQEKLEARKMLENAADSPASSARFVSPLLVGGILFVFTYLG